MSPEWRAAGYHVTLHYLSAPSAEAAVARVAKRVAAGGHAIPEADIRRRYTRSLQNFHTGYKLVVDAWRHNACEDGHARLIDEGQLGI